MAGLTGLIGVVLAYYWRGDDPANPLATHFGKQIRVFWIAAAGTVIALLLSVVGIGFLIFPIVAVYFAVMSVIGLVRAFDNKPWA